ncbi:MAG: nitrate reductase [Gammaproteobacteria bacterium]|jgi:nitrate reductase gamma subunit|nr:nitrate reductase [Gammaproteobacteria bacterium]MBT4462413.1 nitrate reductase [Gammaproteobacteria bacterium]MBT4655340.1 nitrate reductase [Gammaproteobacteria bacterium]MBT5117266.1 nitrate reductase [Gammaproteobacteria bacterium]MBT5762155.1 nitrate reductase [Gammaproteobacteria bacterium]
MSFVTIFYGISFYVATLILFIGLAYRIYEYSIIPAPLKIPTPPAPKTKKGVAIRLFREVVFFESLFSATKWTWLFGWLFHFALLLAAFRHLRYFTDPVWFWVSWEIVQAAGHYAGYMMLFGLLGLLGRRIFVDRVRYISNPSDYLMLILIISIAFTGLLMKWFHTDIYAVKMFFIGLMYFQWSELPSDFVLLLHLSLVLLLMIIFPYSKLLHAPGLFFSPTRNQTDNARDQRHIADWAKRIESKK